MTEQILAERFKINQYQEKYLYSVNRHTFEKESSSNIYKRHYQESLINEETLYLILGTDSGLLISYLLTQDLPENSRYIFIELPEVMTKITEQLSDKLNNDAIILTTADDWQEAAEKFEMSIYIYKNKVNYLKSFAGLDSFIPEYHINNAKVSKELEIQLFFTRALVGVSPFMTKQIMNVSENKHPSNLLNNIFKDKTCIILGGGPSLDDDIAWIKANKNNLVIIAVSRIAKSLIAHDLTPHIIVSVDPYDVSFDVSKELLTLPKDVLFLHANCVTPSLAAQWHGKSAYIGARFPWADDNDENCNLMGGPTVTNTALKEAITMGFSNILLTGVDLCYARNGVSHASGSNEAKVGPALGQQGVWVETYAGNKAETQIAFDNAVAALAKQATEAKTLGINIYNLSENAAKVTDIEHIPSAALSFDDEENNILAVLHQVIPELSAEQIRQDNNMVLKKFEKRLKDIQAIKILAEEALECNQLLFKEKGKETENFKYKLRMDKIEKKIDSKYKKSSRFIKNFGLDKFIKSTQTKHDWSDDKVEETGRLYYQAYIDSCLSLMTHLQACCQRIRNRTEEQKSKPDVEQLLQQWQQDNQFGRTKNWFEKNGAGLSQLTATQQQLYQEHLQTFNEILSSEDTAHLTRTKKEASLNGVRRKIIILYYQRNIDALVSMATRLELYDKSDQQATQLSLLATAYLFAANNDHEQALQCFETLDKEEIQEDELQLMASLAIKAQQPDKAEVILKMLADIADIYQPNYAKLLKLLGKYQESIDEYTRYLEKNYDDIKTWLALAKLYLSLQANESAKMALTVILEKDPENMEAKSYLSNLTSG
ncbi:MAG: 6-hydroxymethylpterin diphosphokinase MptE-like protein [Thalassotalea sp.]